MLTNSNSVPSYDCKSSITCINSGISNEWQDEMPPSPPLKKWTKVYWTPEQNDITFNQLHGRNDIRSRFLHSCKLLWKLVEPVSTVQSWLVKKTTYICWRRAIGWDSIVSVSLSKWLTKSPVPNTCLTRSWVCACVCTWSGGRQGEHAVGTP